MRIILLSLLSLTLAAAETATPMGDLLAQWKKEDDALGDKRMVEVWQQFDAIDKTPLKKIPGDPKDLTQGQNLLNKRIESYNEAYHTLEVTKKDPKRDSWRNIGPRVVNLQRIRAEVAAELKR